MADFDIVHNTDASRFETEVDGVNAVLLYRLEDSRIVFVSTRVPPELEGRGIGSALARAGLEYAREHSLAVAPQCPFVRVYIEKHPEYKPLTTL